jgi:hypothetical protein
MDIQKEKIISITEEIFNKSKEKISLLELLKELNSRNIPLSYDIFNKIKNKLDHYGRYIEIPNFISDFIFKYLSGKKIKNVLDPCANIGHFLNSIVSNYNPEFSLGIDENVQNIEIAKLLCQKNNTRWVFSKPENYLREMLTKKKNYDVIVSCIPVLDYKRTQKEILVNFPQIKTKDKLFDFGFFILDLSCSLLNEKGVGFFIIPSAFLPTVNLSLRKDFYINSVFSLPHNLFRSTGLPFLNLVIISRQKNEEVFVAELNPAINQEIILENLKKRKEGKIESLGFLVPQNQLDIYGRLINKREQKRIAFRYKLKETKIEKELTIEINLSSKKNKDGFKKRYNSVYLPLIGNSNAVTSIEEFKLKSHNYIQLVIREEIALAEYIAFYLNSEMGKIYRENLTSGLVIPKINKGTIKESSIYLPNLEEQRNIIDVQKRVNNVFNKIISIDKTFKINPFNANKIEKEIKPFSRLDSFENWVDNFPFPLASILITYDRSKEIYYKLNHLFNFFEALTQFNVVLMLSAYHSETEFFEEHKNKWFDKKESNNYFERSTFGSWLTIAERLARFTREGLNEKSLKKEKFFELFKTKRISFIESLTNKELYKTLKEVKDLRNRKAHGGVETPEYDLQKLTLLKTKLSKIRSIIDNYDGINLVKPGPLKISGGIYKYKITNLMGSRNIFKEQKCDLIEQMDEKFLYLLDLNYQRPLELLPFIKFSESPSQEKNACYFYNHINKEGVHWISYHFKEESEITEKDQSFKKYLKILSTG